MKAIFNISNDFTCFEVDHTNFGILLNDSTVLDESLTETSAQPSGTVCRVTVSGIIVKVPKGDITFFAKEKTNEADPPISMSCNILIKGL